MHFISIGPYCITAEIIREAEYRTLSCPFDWIFSSLDMVKHCIDDEFKTFLNLDLINNHSHIHYDKYLNTPVINHQYRRVFGHTNRPLITFNHDLLHDEETYKKYKRRCERFLNLIKTNEIIGVYTIDGVIIDIDEILLFQSKIEFPLLVIYINSNEEELLEEVNQQLFIYTIKTIDYKKINDIFGKIISKIL